MARSFPTVESQRESARVLQERLFVARLQRAGFSVAAMQAFTARRIDAIRAGKV